MIAAHSPHSLEKSYRSGSEIALLGGGDGPKGAQDHNRKKLLVAPKEMPYVTIVIISLRVTKFCMNLRRWCLSTSSDRAKPSMNSFQQCK